MKKESEKTKQTAENFTNKIKKKYKEKLLGVCILSSEKKNKEKDDKIRILVLYNDKAEENKKELLNIREDIIKTGKEFSEEFLFEVTFLSQIWEDCFDNKHEIRKAIVSSISIYDTGIIGALKITELHKEAVIQKFEKYIVAYVIFGSLARGQANEKSDIDVGIIVDDTDVKKMTRAELKDKLRAIIIGMGMEAGEKTGIKNKLNIQVYILTDFWDAVKEAHPVIFTLLRDGIPFYDRGIFMPWKHLLRIGKIRPSPEAIEMFMNTGEQVVSRVKRALTNLVEADIYWATLTPAQAAIMLYGLPPPTPKETILLLEEIFVKKEKLLEKNYVDILKKIRNYYKDLEHNQIRSISGKEIDELISDVDKYIKRLKKLFAQIEKIKREEQIIKIYDDVISVIRDALLLEGLTDVKEEDIVKEFNSQLINKGRIPQNLLAKLKEIIKAKKDYKEGKLTKQETDKAITNSRNFIKEILEYIHRRRSKELEHIKIRIKHGDKFGEVLFLDKEVFIIYDLEQEDKEITKAEIKDDGSLGKIKKTDLEELEKATSKIKPEKRFIRESIIESLKQIFGKDMEISLNQY